MITPNRKAPASTLYQNLTKPVVTKKRSAALNTGQLIKEQPLQKPAVSKIRSSVKVTTALDEKYVKRIGAKKPSVKTPAFNIQTPKPHNFTDNSIHDERQDTL